MRKNIFLILALIITCGGAENTSIQDTTTTTVQDTTTTTVQDTTTTTVQDTTTTTAQKLFLIEEFSFKTDRRNDSYPVGYLFAEVKSDILWDFFRIETLDENGNICPYYLNDKQVDYSRLLFIPELGCEPGIYTVSKIEIGYKDKQFTFNSENNQLEETDNLICCNFEEVFNWRVEVGREINDKCKFGYISNIDKCISSFPIINYINLSEDENNNMVIEYEFEIDETITKDKTILFFIFDFQSSSGSQSIGLLLSDYYSDPNVIKANPFKDSIVLLKNSDYLKDLKLNVNYELFEITIIFYKDNTDIRNMLCTGVVRLYDSFQLENQNKGYSLGGRDDLCSFDKYETIAYTEKTKASLQLGGFEPNEWTATYYFDTNLIFDFQYSR